MWQKTCVVGLLWLVGCGSGRFYDWGRYENSLYRMYTQGESYMVEKDIDVLSKEIEQTLSKAKRVPPGKHAHLGFLFYTYGDTASAEAHFRAEKAAFPESGHLMDRLLEKLH